MKYTITINQKELLAVCPDINGNEAIVLDYLVFYCSSINEKIESHRIEGFTWINYQTLIDDLPILSGRTTASMVCKIKRLKELGLIDTMDRHDEATGHAKKYIKLTVKALAVYTDRIHSTLNNLNDLVKISKQPHLENLTNNNTNDKITNDTKDIYTLPIFEFWNSKGIVVHNNPTDKIIKAIKKCLKDYTEKEVMEAIGNYSIIINDKTESYRFNYKWTLGDFLNRGIDKFLPNADPLNNFKKQNYKSQYTGKKQAYNAGCAAPREGKYDYLEKP
jgi:hypothetical protein